MALRVIKESSCGPEEPVKSVTGRWRITEMDVWDREAIDLVQPGFIEFTGDGFGCMGFIAVKGELDCRDVARDGRPGVEFSLGR